MIARLRTFPLPTRDDLRRFADHSMDAIGAALLIFGGVVIIAFASTVTP